MSNVICFAWKSLESESFWEDGFVTSQVESKWMKYDDLLFVGWCREKHPITKGLHKLKGIAIRKIESKVLKKRKYDFDEEGGIKSYIFYDRYYKTDMMYHHVKIKNDPKRGNFTDIDGEYTSYEKSYKIQTINLGGDKQYFGKEPIRQFIASVVSHPTYCEKGTREPLLFLFHIRMVVSEKYLTEHPEFLNGFKTMVKINPLIK